jgi:hypothetical protein
MADFPSDFDLPEAFTAHVDKILGINTPSLKGSS